MVVTYIVSRLCLFDSDIAPIVGAKDANGNEITASQQLTSKAGFFQKLVAFFKKLFGSFLPFCYYIKRIDE